MLETWADMGKPSVVTDKVEYIIHATDGILNVLRCACGATFERFTFLVWLNDRDGTECRYCHHILTATSETNYRVFATEILPKEAP